MRDEEFAPFVLIWLDRNLDKIAREYVDRGEIEEVIRLAGRRLHQSSHKIHSEARGFIVLTPEEHKEVLWEEKRLDLISE